jgi:hypothetical protein
LIHPGRKFHAPKASGRKLDASLVVNSATPERRFAKSRNPINSAFIHLRPVGNAERLFNIALWQPAAVAKSSTSMMGACRSLNIGPRLAAVRLAQQ